MRSIHKVVALLALAGMACAQPLPSDSGTTKAPKKKAVHQKARRDQTSEQLQQLKDMVQQQQSQMQQMQQQIQQTQQQLQQTQQQLVDAQKAAQDANTKVATVESTSTTQVQKVQADLSDVKTALNTTTETVKTDQKRVSDLEHPTALRYKGITFTPGGFLAAESIWRQRAENNDMISSFNGVPFNNSPASHMSEFRFTARQSRASLLAEGKLGSAKLSGYYEIDFLGAAPTANENQTSSFTPRQRQLFGQVAFNNGWTITGGQMWSLITLDRKGADARAEWVPATIDGEFVVGYNWNRNASVRVAKSFADKKATIAFSAENPASLIGGAVPANVVTGGTGVVALANGVTYTTNLAPDLIAKVALDPGWGHYELKGVGRFFRDRVIGGTNNVTLGGGLAAGAILPVGGKKADLILEAMAGRGIARYGDSSNVDVIIRPSGAISTVRNLHAVAGLELHPTSKLDWYFYGGDEYLDRNVGLNGTTYYGWGSPTLDNSKCYVESGFACTANLKNLVQGNTGFWYRFYKGTAGTVQYGIQYSYTLKTTWSGLNSLAPRASDSMVMSSFRYYLP